MPPVAFIIKVSFLFSLKVGNNFFIAGQNSAFYYCKIVLSSVNASPSPSIGAPLFTNNLTTSKPPYFLTKLKTGKQPCAENVLKSAI
jgi:hypothetical protein